MATQAHKVESRRVALVTGGSRGIGLAIARSLVSAGTDVAITGRSQSHLDEAATTLGGTVFAVQADISDPAAAARAVDSTADRFGGLDILVNNAGIGIFANVADMEVSQWRQLMETNVSGVFFCCRAAIPHLRQRGGGWIINISSLAAKNPFARGAAYCASKAALTAFSEALMQEVRYDKIRVSCVMPGSVATRFGGRDGPDTADDWKLSPDDVAQAVTDLLAHPARSLPSRVEIRPSVPPRK